MFFGTVYCIWYWYVFWVGVNPALTSVYKNSSSKNIPIENNLTPDKLPSSDLAYCILRTYIAYFKSMPIANNFIPDTLSSSQCFRVLYPTHAYCLILRVLYRRLYVFIVQRLLPRSSGHLSHLSVSGLASK